MEYTAEEREFLNLTDRTDFKHLSKNDVISYASKLHEMRPEVAREVLAKYPELAGLIRTLAIEYEKMLSQIIESDDESISQVYNAAHTCMENSASRRRSYYEFAEKIRADLSKCLASPGITEEERREIMSQQVEVLRMVDSQMREADLQEQEILNVVDKKDSEKRAFNWKALGVASTLVSIAISVGAAALGGKFDFKLPAKQ